MTEGQQESEPRDLKKEVKEAWDGARSVFRDLRHEERRFYGTHKLSRMPVAGRLRCPLCRCFRDHLAKHLSRKHGLSQAQVAALTASLRSVLSYNFRRAIGRAQTARHTRRKAAEVEAGLRIPCMECLADGSAVVMKLITHGHLVRLHSMDWKEYARRYPGAPRAAPALREAASRTARALVQADPAKRLVLRRGAEALSAWARGARTRRGV